MRVGFIGSNEPMLRQPGLEQKWLEERGTVAEDQDPLLTKSTW